MTSSCNLELTLILIIINFLIAIKSSKHFYEKANYQNMIDKEFEKILTQGESYTVEFKRSISKEIKNKICSFVNSSGGRIHIEIYDNRVEITNPGGLVNTIKEDEFGQRSVSRNPKIFSFFQRLDLVEQVGSGISRMREKMKDENLPAPHFSLKGIFVVTLYRPTDFNKWIESWEDKISKYQMKICN